MEIDGASYDVWVALRKESVDRNSVPFRPASHLSKSLSARRAWIEIACPLGPQAIYPSLSARRAWIEMTYVTRLPRAQVSLSARRAWIEINDSLDSILAGVSLSARRAWIEILCCVGFCLGAKAVALRKESVDRNISIHTSYTSQQSRSPQGERG